MTTLAQQVEGLRTVSGSSERDAIFPTPAFGQKVYNQTTGNIEQWGGVAWSIIVTGTPGIATEFNVRSYGAVGDGTADDTVAVQAAVTAASAVASGAGTGGAIVRFPAGTYRITTQITVAGSVALRGSGMASTIVKFYGCHGVSLVEAGQVHDMQLASYSGAGAADPKLYDGITGAGTVGSQVHSLRVSNVYLRGWSRCIYAKYTWDSVFDGVVTVNCDKGYVSFGLSCNNTITNANIIATTRCLSLELDGVTRGEGLCVTGSVLASAAIGVYGEQFMSLNMVGCVIDQMGVAFDLTNVTGTVVGCWVYANANCFTLQALSSITTGSFKVVGCPAIQSVTARAFEINALNRFVSIVGNNITFATLALWTASNATDGAFVGNTCVDSTGVQPQHITLQAAGWRITANAGDCKLLVSANVRSARLNNADQIVTHGFTAKPAAGTWKEGDIVLRDNQGSAGEWAWLCVVAGTPGTWIPLVVPAVSQIDADSSYTIANVGAEFPTVYFNVALGSNRTLTLPSRASSWQGRKFRIVRVGGAGTLTVQDPTGPTTLKVLPAATPSFCDVEYAGALATPQWILTAYGAL